MADLLVTQWAGCRLTAVIIRLNNQKNMPKGNVTSRLFAKDPIFKLANKSNTSATNCNTKDTMFIPEYTSLTYALAN